VLRTALALALALFALWPIAPVSAQVPPPRRPSPGPAPSFPPAVLPDSATAADSAGVVAGPGAADSAGVVADSAAAEAAERPLQWWRRDWLLTQLGPAAGEPSLGRDELFHATAGLFSEMVQRDVHLGLHAAGSPIAWDLPYDLGPGVERLSLWLDGATTMGPALGEAQCQTVSPLLLGDVRCLAPDPFLDPLGAAGDGMIWTASQEPSWEDVPSQVRFTEGVAQLGTQDVLYARQTGKWRTLASYAHASAQGRQAYPSGLQRYRTAGFQNLLLQVDRAFTLAAPRLTASDREGRYTLEGNRKLYWGSTRFSAGAQVPWGTERTAQIEFARRSERLQWWGPTDSARREARTFGVNGQAALPAGPARLLLAAAYERVRTFWSTHAAGDTAWNSNGTGMAIGWQMGDDHRSVTATAGWTDPWWTRGHARARLVVVQQLSPSATLCGEAWTGRAGVFIPRLEPDGDALVGEGLHLLGDDPAADGPVRRIVHAQLASHWRPGGARLGAALFARHIADALGLDSEEAGALLPEVRTREDLMHSLAEVTLIGARFQGRVPLVWGLRAEGAVTAVLDPPLEQLPVLVAPVHGSGGIFLAGRAFKGDLAYELGLTAQGQGQWHTPWGPVPARVQVDAMISAVFLERAHLFVQFYNLTDEFFESATYDEGWGALPYRSSTIGLEWHFLD